MKKLLVIVMLVFVGGMLMAACPPPPEPKVCPEGEFTVEESECFETTYKKEKKCYKIPYCKKWRGWRCKEWGYKTKCYYRWVVDVPAYCTEPVCKAPKEACEAKMYVLQGNGTCSLGINRAEGDVNGKLPARYANNGKLTQYGQGECNKCRNTPFDFNGTFSLTCKEPCVDCK